MASGLREKSKVDYAKLNDFPPEVLNELKWKSRSPTWRSNQAFPIEIKAAKDPLMVGIHFIGYGAEFDKTVCRNELIVVEPPPSVNGPDTVLKLGSVLFSQIQKELNCHNHALVTREIRIETTPTVLNQLLEKLGYENFNSPIQVSKWESLLGKRFFKRYLNMDGDYSIITSAISCRTYFAPPDISFKPKNGLIVEHHRERNPMLHLKFVVEKFSSHFDDSFEFKE